MSSSAPVDPFAKKGPGWSDDTVSSMSPSENNSKSIEAPVDSINKASASQRVQLTTESSRISLVPPVYSDYEINFRLIEAMKAYRALRLSDNQAGIEMRKKRTVYLEEQAHLFSELLAEKKKLSELTRAEIDDLFSKIQDVSLGMEEDIVDQNKLIEALQLGNREEKNQYATLDRAYQEYLYKLKEMGAIDASGLVTPPNDAKNQEKYRAATEDYKKALETFNTYFQDRKSAIADYNTSTAAYNEKVSVYNNKIRQLLEEKGLDSYAAALPTLSPISLLDITHLSDWSAQSRSLSSPPFILKSLSQEELSIAKNGPSLQPLIRFPSFATLNARKGEMYQTLLKSRGEDIDRKIDAIPFLQYFTKMEAQKSSDKWTETNEIFIKALKKVVEKSYTENSISSVSNAMVSLAIGGNDPKLHALLGQLITEEIIKRNIADKQNKTVSENQEALPLKEVKESADQGNARTEALLKLPQDLLILSIGLLSNLVGESFLSGLTLLGDSLSSISSESPAVNIAFSSAILKCALEDHKSGLLHSNIEKFIESQPANSLLSQNEKKALIASVELGVLLTAAKLFETSVGIPNLVSSCMLPSNKTESSSPDSVNVEGEKALAVTFLKQDGFEESAAQFLATHSDTLLMASLIQPKIKGEVPSDSIDVRAVQNSLKAALVFNDIPFTVATQVANDVADAVLSSHITISPQTFYKELEVHLKDLGIEHPVDIAASVPFVFTAQNIESKSQADMAYLIESRVVEMVSKEMGLSRAKELAQSVSELFQLADKNPLSLEKSIASLGELIGNEWRGKWQQTLESAKMPLVSEVLIKLLDPAKTYLRYAGGPTHEIAGTKKTLDVQI